MGVIRQDPHVAAVTPVLLSDMTAPDAARKARLSRFRPLAARPAAILDQQAISAAATKTRLPAAGRQTVWPPRSGSSDVRPGRGAGPLRLPSRPLAGRWILPGDAARLQLR